MSPSTAAAQIAQFSAPEVVAATTKIAVPNGG
jgi:hypothetical protein